MPADLLDRLLVKVTRVAHQAAGNIVCVLQAVEDVIDHGCLRALLQICLRLLSGGVEVRDPVVVLSSQVGGDMALELNHVAVGNLLCVGRGENRSSLVVDRLDHHWRCRRQQRQRHAEERLHDRGSEYGITERNEKQQSKMRLMLLLL